MAPEIIENSPAYRRKHGGSGRRYNHTVDVWAIGVLFYYFLTNDLPFGSCHRSEELSQMNLFERIMG